MFGGLAEESDIEHVSFGGVGDGGLRGRDCGRNQVRFDGVGVDVVVELGKGAIEVPGERQAAVFVFLEALEFLDEVEFELDRYPGSEFKGDVLVGVGAAVSSRFGDQPDGMGRFDPLLCGEDEAVEAGLLFKPIEFEGFKTRIVQALPDTQELDGIAIRIQF